MKKPGACGAIAVLAALIALNLELVSCKSSLEEEYKKHADSIAGAGSSASASFEHADLKSFGDIKKEKRGSSLLNQDKDYDKGDRMKQGRTGDKTDSRYSQPLSHPSIPSNPKEPIGTYDYYDDKGKLHVVSYINDEMGYRVLNDYLPYEPLTESGSLKPEEQMLFRDAQSSNSAESKYDPRGRQPSFYESRPFSFSSSGSPRSYSSSDKYYGKIPPSYSGSIKSSDSLRPYYSSSSSSSSSPSSSKSQKSSLYGDEIVLPVLYPNSAGTEIISEEVPGLFSGEIQDGQKLALSSEEEEEKSLYGRRPSSNSYTSGSSSIPLYGPHSGSSSSYPHGSGYHPLESYPIVSSGSGHISNYPISGSSHSVGSSYPVSSGSGHPSSSYPIYSGSSHPLGGYPLSPISSHSIGSYPISSASGSSSARYPYASSSIRYSPIGGYSTYGPSSSQSLGRYPVGKPSPGYSYGPSYPSKPSSGYSYGSYPPKSPSSYSYGPSSYPPYSSGPYGSKYSSSPYSSYKRPMTHGPPPPPPRRPIGVSGYLGSLNQASHHYNHYQKPPMSSSFPSLFPPFGHGGPNPFPPFLNHF